MYYDRRIPEPLLALVQPEAPLGWLLPWLNTERAARAGAHVQTRRDRGNRRHGGIQVYLGRTSPMEIRGGPRGQFRIHADPFYQELSPGLFDADFDHGQLTARTDALRDHLERAADKAHRAFLDGEAVVHAGLMRHYGALAGSDMPFLALDSEVRMGFEHLEAQKSFEDSLPERVGLPSGEEVPRKLDLVAVGAGGHLLAVEVKAKATGLVRAAWQAAVHVARFRALLDEDPAWFKAVLGGLARQKADVGLLGRAKLPSFTNPPTIVPVLAAPDERAEWLSCWRTELAPVLAAARGQLDGLRLWRLDPTGHVTEDALA